MKTLAWIAGSLLILAMAQTAQAQQGRVAQEPQNANSVQLPKGPAADDVQSRRDKAQGIR